MPPKHPISRNTNDIFHKRISDLETRVDGLVTNKITTVPLHDPANMPPQAVSGQIAISDPDSSPAKTGYAYDEVNGWWPLGGAVTWIYVGTAGVDGIDSLLAANPHPYATGDTPGPPPFVTGTDALGGLGPVAFALHGNTTLLLSGAFSDDVTAGDTIFVLPTSFRPVTVQPIIFPMSDLSAICKAFINTDGTVVYEGTI